MVFPRQLVLVSILLIISLISESHAKKRVSVTHKIPSYFPTCYRNDPELNKCLLEATKQVRPFLAKGVPELRIPLFEPFTIPEIHLEQGTNALNFKATLKNVVAHGLTKYEFSRFNFDVPNLQFFCDAKIPAINLEGDYTVTGRVLIAPIEGNGRFTANIDSCDVFVYQKYKEETLKDGKIHLIPLMTNSSIEVSGPKAELQGLFNGNEQLNAATNKAINDNVDELFADLKPVVEHTISRIMEDVLLKSFIENIPFDDLYPIKK